MPQPTDVLQVKDELCQRGVLAAVAEYTFHGHHKYVEQEGARIVREYGEFYDPQILTQIMGDYAKVAKMRSRSLGH